MPVVKNEAQSKYEAARELVERHWDPIVGTVRSLRERGVPLSAMHYQVLRSALPPEVHDADPKELTSRFATWTPDRPQVPDIDAPAP